MPRKTISVFDDGSCPDEDDNLAKETNDVANIDQFGPTTSSFLQSPAANGIAGFLFSEMQIKEQALVKLRSKFAHHHSSVSAATRSELSQAGSCRGPATFTSCDCTSFRLHPTRSRRFRLVDCDSPVEMNSRELHFFVSATQALLEKTFRNVRRLAYT